MIELTKCSGGIAGNIWIRSEQTSASITGISFCLYNPFSIKPVCLPPQNAFRRYFGAKTTWYFPVPCCVRYYMHVHKKTPLLFIRQLPDRRFCSDKGFFHTLRTRHKKIQEKEKTERGEKGKGGEATKKAEKRKKQRKNRKEKRKSGKMGKGKTKKMEITEIRRTERRKRETEKWGKNGKKKNRKRQRAKRNKAVSFL